MQTASHGAYNSWTLQQALYVHAQLHHKPFTGMLNCCLADEANSHAHGNQKGKCNKHMANCRRSTLRACNSEALYVHAQQQTPNTGVKVHAHHAKLIAQHQCVQRWHFACPAQTQVSASNLQGATEALCVPCSNSSKCKHTTQPRTQVRAGSALHCHGSGCRSLAKCNCSRSTSTKHVAGVQQATATHHLTQRLHACRPAPACPCN